MLKPLQINSFESDFHQLEKESYVLHSLTKLLSQVLPSERTINPFEEELEKQLNENQLAYLPLITELVNQFTLLFRHNRVRTKEGYQSCWEDITAVLSILQGNLSPLSVLSSQAFYAYQKLVESPIKIFTRRDAMKITGYEKTSVHRILHELLKYGLVEQTGFKNKGFFYRIVPISKLVEDYETKIC